MTKMALIGVMLAAAAQAASAQMASVKTARFVGSHDAAQDYWDRESWANSRYYGNIVFSSKDLDGLSEKVQKLLGAAGATLTSVNTFKPETTQTPQRQRAHRNFGYKVPADRIDEVAKKLAALAPVDSYSVNTMHKGQPSPAREVQERIDALSAELEANKEALKKMPIARALYASKLDRLKRALENLGDAEDMMFNISVTMDDR